MGAPAMNMPMFVPTGMNMGMDMSMPPMGTGTWVPEPSKSYHLHPS
jgi:hypothetical protein